MKKAQVALCVGLEDKMKRVSKHWVGVDAVLPPEYPLLLLSGVRLEPFCELRQRLMGLRDAFVDAKVAWGVARAEYKLLKGELHRWLLQINSWMRGQDRGTAYFVLVRRVPGLGQSYQHWLDATRTARAMWRQVADDPVSHGPGRSPALGGGRTLEEFEVFAKKFEAVYWAISPAKVEADVARSAIAMAEAEATALLMAYGHGVRARLGQKHPLVRTLPRLWPKHKPRKK